MMRHLEKSGLRVHFDYSVWLPQVAERDLSGEFDVIYGHFPITRYVGPNYRYIALVRDPMERCLSSYKFHRKFGVENPHQTDFYSRVGRWIDRGELSVREYVRICPDMRSTYQYFLGHWPRERFDLVGTTERYGDFLAMLSALLGVTFTNNIRERQSEEKVDIPPEDVAPIKSLLAAEYAWVRSVTTAYQTQAA